MSRLRSVVALSLFGVMSLACTRVKVQDARGPDGADWKVISCSRMNKKCFKVAEKMCPSGYVFSRGEKGTVSSGGAPNVTTLPPQDEWRDEMYSKKPGKILVRCTTSPGVGANGFTSPG